MSPAKGCPKCGAPAEGLLCRFCGSLLEVAEAPEEQLKALDEYHGAIGKADAEAQKEAAGLWIHPRFPAGADRSRGDVYSPLPGRGGGCFGRGGPQARGHHGQARSGAGNGRDRKALERFREVIEERKRKDRSDTQLGCTMFTILAAILVALAAYLIHRFTR